MRSAFFLVKVELFSHHDSFRNIVHSLTSSGGGNFRLACVQLVDSHLCTGSLLSFLPIPGVMAVTQCFFRCNSSSRGKQVSERAHALAQQHAPP